jgi:hypothetical protein
VLCKHRGGFGEDIANYAENMQDKIWKLNQMSE